MMIVDQDRRNRLTWHGWMTRSARGKRVPRVSVAGPWFESWRCRDERRESSIHQIAVPGVKHGIGLVDLATEIVETSRSQRRSDIARRDT